MQTEKTPTPKKETGHLGPRHSVSPSPREKRKSPDGDQEGSLFVECSGICLSRSHLFLRGQVSMNAQIRLLNTRPPSKM
eukprot:1140306-Pelagomonas_calceolata.AAC.1